MLIKLAVVDGTKCDSIWLLPSTRGFAMSALVEFAPAERMLSHNEFVDPGFHRMRIAVVSMCVLVVVVLWLEHGRAFGAFDVTATSVATVAAILTIVGPRLFPVRPVVLDELLDEAARALATALIDQWSVEARARGYEHAALPVRFTPVADPALALGEKRRVRLPGQERKRTLEQIIAMLARTDSPRRLVVLGEVGAGKSAFVLRVALELLHARDGAPSGATGPVPVLLAAGSWDPAKPLATWVAARLAEQYAVLGLSVKGIDSVSKTVAEVLVERKRVLPILDGLDEMAHDNRVKAWSALSSAARQGHPFVVTCRSREYLDLTTRTGREPLEFSPVIELEPVAPTEARDYLSRATAPATSRWDPLLKYLQSHRRGALAQVLSTPLMLWLARTVYWQADADPTDLIAMGTDPHQVREHLLDGLIPAAYTGLSGRSHYPEQAGPQLERTRRALAALARFARVPGNADIAWWRLHELVPARRIRVSAALVTGVVLGAAVGIAVSAKYGPLAGFAAGMADAVVAGSLCAATVMIPKAVPRRLTFRFSLRAAGLKPLGGLAAGLAVGLTFGFACAHGGGMLAGAVVFLVVTPVSALAVGSVFGTIPGVTGGTSAGLAFGLAAVLVEHRSSAVLPGVVTGAVFAVMGWLWTALYEPAPEPQAVSPDYLYRGDRTGSLVVGLTSGLAYGVAFTIALGPWIGMLATLVLAFSVTLTVSSWGQFAVASLWRPLGRDTPRNVMGLLREAHERGVLRQNGMYYQFRHDLLAEHLAKSMARAFSDCETRPPVACNVAL